MLSCINIYVKWVMQQQKKESVKATGKKTILDVEIIAMKFIFY